MNLPGLPLTVYPEHAGQRIAAAQLLQPAVDRIRSLPGQAQRLLMPLLLKCSDVGIQLVFLRRPFGHLKIKQIIDRKSQRNTDRDK
ncbi:hypothetical protein D3C80_1788170 [compost metagenome]